MELINKQFNQCPSCGSHQRFCETLANEVKEKGYAREDWSFSFDSRQGVVTDKTREASIPVGTSMPGFQITTDICLECGTIYAISIQSGEVTKSIVHPKLFKPGDEPIGNDPRYS